MWAPVTWEVGSQEGSSLSPRVRYSERGRPSPVSKPPVQHQMQKWEARLTQRHAGLLSDSCYSPERSLSRFTSVGTTATA